MSRRRARWSGVVVIAFVVLSAACTSSSDDSSSPTTDSRPPAARAAVPTRLAQFANTLTGFVGSADGSEMLVSDRLGAVWRLRSSGTGGALPDLDPEPALDLTDSVSASPGERGFFALALTPDGRSLVVDYTAKDGAITVQQYPYRPGHDIDPAAARTLLHLPDPYGWHHGGGLAFDADANLYVGIGDMEFRQVDPPGSQDPKLMLGGVLRIPAEVVTDPSVVSEPGPADMIARGMRNPWRVSIDATTGGLWIGDVGLDTYEEINFIPKEDLGGGKVTNFGWPYREGPVKQQGTAPPGTKLVAPVLATHHREGVCGMVGGFRYRGTRLEGLRGRFIYGDLCGQTVRALTLRGASKVTADGVVADIPETIASFGEDASGELYLLGAMGGFYRLDPVGSVNQTSKQHPRVEETSTTIPRSRPDCDGGIVAAVKPLTDVATMSGPELSAALAKANARLDELVTTVPAYLHDDAVIVQRAIRALATGLEGAQGDAAALAPLRADLLAGRGPFVGFPDAMASVVDSECG